MLCMGCMEENTSGLRVCPHCGYVAGCGPEEVYYLPPGVVLQNKYIVGRVLGYGGFGVTYIAYDQQLKRKVAIKEYLPSDFSTRSTGNLKVTVFPGEAAKQFADGMKSFVQEARRLAKFNDIHVVVDIYDCFIENDTGYIVMEYLSGKNVKQILKEVKRMEYDWAESIIIEVLKGLSIVHKEGIIHRDIAPDNIFILDNGEVRLIDFGASRYATTVYSKSLSVILKPGYAPEEQYRSRGEQGSWTDIYAVAATFYRMITGKRPPESVERMIEDKLVPPSIAGAKLLPAKENAIMNALNVRQEDRIQTADEFLEALSNSRTKRKAPKKKRDPRKLPIWLAATIGAAAILTVVTIGIFSGRLFEEEEDVVETDVAVAQDGQVNVPQFATLSFEEAKELADRSGVEVQMSDEIASDIIAYQRIISQEPAYGTVVNEGSMVSLVISGGTESTMVPDVCEHEKEEAEQLLREYSLNVVYGEPQTSEEIAKDCVISQSIAAGTSVDADSEIILVLSKGTAEDVEKRKVKMIDVTGEKYEDAKSALKKAGFVYVSKKEEYSDTVPAGEVIHQSIPAEERVENAETVALTVSLGKEQIRVPSVNLKTESEAKKILKKAGLGKVVVKEESSTEVEAGKVCRQEPKVDKMADKGEKVTIWISTGRPVVSTPASNTGGQQNTSGQDTPAAQQNPSQDNAPAVPETQAPQPAQEAPAPQAPAAEAPASDFTYVPEDNSGGNFSAN